MEETCRKLDSQNIDASIDLVCLNNLIVKMRHSCRKARVQVINKLCRNIKQLKNKKGTDEQVKKNVKKADRMYREVTVIKDLPLDKISKFSLANTATIDEVCKDPSVSMETRAMTRLACCPAMKNDVENFRGEHDDWESLAKFLLYKQTGRRYKKTRVKRAGSEAMKEMVVKQLGGNAGDRTGRKNVTGCQIEKDVIGGELDDSGAQKTDSDQQEKSDSNEESDADDSGVDDRNVIQKVDADNGSESSSKDSAAELCASSQSNKEVRHTQKDAETEPCGLSRVQDEASYKTSGVYEKRLKHLNIFTVNEDEDASSDQDDSESIQDDDNESGSGSLEGGDEGQATDSSEGEDDEEEEEEATEEGDDDDDEITSESSAPFTASVAERNLSPNAGKGKGVKQSKLVRSEKPKANKDSEHSRVKPAMKKSKQVKNKKDDSQSSSDVEISVLEEAGIKTAPKHAKEPVNVKRGALVVQKLNIDIEGSDDIVVSSGDECESDDDTPDILFSKSEADSEKKESKDAFFLTGDGDESEENLLENEAGDGDSSGVEDEDAETTHYRGRQMIESVFIGALSKPDSHKKDGNEFRTFHRQGRGGRDSFDHRDRRGAFQERGRFRGSHDRGGYRGSFEGHRGSFEGHRGNRGSSYGHDRGRGGSRGHHGDRGSHRGRGGGSESYRHDNRGFNDSKPFGNKTYGSPNKKPDDSNKGSKGAEKIHPSWEASRKRKEQASIHSFQGKKIKFDDSD